MFAIRSLRFRIAATFIIGTMVVSGLVAGATYFLVSRQLTTERVNTAQNQTWKSLDSAKAFISRKVRENKVVTAAEVRDRLQARGDVAVFGPDGVVESVSARLDEGDVPDALQEAVQGGRVAYTIIGGDRRRIIMGSPIPETDGRGAVYFAYPLGTTDRTLSVLRRVFIAVIGGAALVAGAVGVRLASATIRPLRMASEAARRVASGDLETRLVVSGQDELGDLADSFNQMTEALEARIARERQFVADASHELRTPLTALKTSIDFLATRQEELPQKFRSVAGLASDEVRSLQRLVDYLLELSRVDAGGVSVETEEINLSDFTKEVARRRAPQADVSISGLEELIVSTDKMRLERVVGNLLENAVFHGGDGPVEISIGHQPGTASIVVVDHGPGIDSAEVTRIFERFWRGDSSRQRDGRIGAGLGLSIARENAAVIGADIVVSSEVGQGARFEVRLPDGVS